MKKPFLAKALAVIIFGIVSISPVFLPTNNTYAYDPIDICSSDAPDPVKDANGCFGGSSSGISNTIQGIINGIIGAAGLVAVIFIVIGGINYMTSAGDSNKVEKGKKTILYATIGLIICALSFAIVNWVIGTVLKQ